MIPIKKIEFHCLKNPICILIAFLFLQSCLTTSVKENEMKFGKQKISFLFNMGENRIEGDFKQLNGIYDIMVKLNDDILSGQVSSVFGSTAYSMIFKNKFVKGAITADNEKYISKINLNIYGKNVTGDVSYGINEAVFNLIYNGIPGKCGYVYDKVNKNIKWTMSYDNKDYTVSINEKPNLSKYEFSPCNLDEDEVILFIMLEIFRMMK